MHNWWLGFRKLNGGKETNNIQKLDTEIEWYCDISREYHAMRIFKKINSTTYTIDMMFQGGNLETICRKPLGPTETCGFINW